MSKPIEMDEVMQRAVQAMLAVLGPAVGEVAAVRALQAVHEVYEAEQEAFVQSQLDQTLLHGFDVTDRGARVRFQMARETAAGIVLAFKDLLGDAENYVEQEVVDRETLERYVCIVVRPGQKTPHDLRREAEEALEQVRREALRPACAEMVREFHQRFTLPVASEPTVDIPWTLALLRLALQEEEYNELDVAINSQDVVAIADALADIVYVAYGTALTYGIDLDAVLREVHRSNLTKDPGPTGKAVKGGTYQPPDVAGVLGVRDA